MLPQNIFKKYLKFRLYLFVVFCFSCISVHAQSIENIDSLLIDRNLENYSVRLFSNFKVKKFSIKDGNSKAKFVPNNRYGLGFGVASKKFIIDLAFNIKNPNKEETKRFDLQATTIVKKQHYVNAFIQTYKGFNAKSDFDVPTVFRSDIRSVTFGVNYLYTFDEVAFSYSQLKAGLAEKRNKNMYITGGLGFFGVFDYFSAKPSLFDEETSIYFNEDANVKRYRGGALGLLAGFVSYFKLPENITATFNFMPGIALMNKKVTLQDDSYRPSNPMLYKIDFNIGLGYSIDRYYVSLTYGNGYYTTDFDNDNDYFFNLSNAKLAIGYKLKRKKKE
ncbi:DUF4421 family protein [Lacinutrix gracilariae]|uniref:DUF4421 family protein n=1 Tax=Lacinutrix gracilariae TaxID=1747198 RepID=A0ABW5JYP3_9FLAO